MRSNTVKAFRYFGVGRKSHREKIKEEINHVICEIKKYNGLPFDPSELCSVSICNVMCAIVFGKRYDYQDQDLIHLLNIFYEILRLGGGLEVVNIFPFLRYLPGDLFGCHRVKSLIEECLGFVSAQVQSHASSLDKDNPRDYIDVLLNQSNFQQDEEVVLTGMYVYGKQTTFVCLFICCFTLMSAIFQSYMWRHTYVKADWISLTYFRDLCP